MMQDAKLIRAARVAAAVLRNNQAELEDGDTEESLAEELERLVEQYEKLSKTPWTNVMRLNILLNTGNPFGENQCP